MKSIKFYRILVMTLVTMLTSCNDVLDKRPLDILSDDVIWDDPSLVDKYMANQYANMSVLKFDSPQYPSSLWTDVAGFMNVMHISDEVGMPVWGLVNVHAYKIGGLTVTGGLLEYWELPYTIIRQLNTLIDKLPNSSNDKAFIESRLAEARFLRVLNYFYMVKRYGGVPLETEALPLDASKDKMFPKRSSEKAVYDFIITELDAVAEQLDGLPAQYGRATQGAALALKCRTALYAGSIAQFGTVQLDGLLGIPQAEATSYYQKAYDAAKKIQSLGKYELYNNEENKVQNYKNVFLNERNSEMIFVKQYKPTVNGWLWCFILCPKPHGYDAGMAAAPYLETAEEFEYTDGRPGKLDREKIQQGLWSMDELWKDKDPRFFATIWTNGTPWKGGHVDSHHGLIGGDGVLYEDQQDAYEGIPAWGNQHFGGIFGSGFGVLKMLNDASNANMEEFGDGTDCPVFRYAEVLLNLAEAAFELGKTNEALDAINQIRTRAGIAPKTTIDREAIRHERKVELLFEGHRYWDVRRWRIAEDVLSKHGSGLRFILDYNATNFTSDDFNTSHKYKIQVLSNYDGRQPQFNACNYYLPITNDRTGQNPNLVENPGYK